MYYDDEARRFNFLSGLLLGAVLGTGIGLLVGPEVARKKPAGVRRVAKKRIGAGLDAARDRTSDVADLAAKRVRAVARRAG